MEEERNTLQTIKRSKANSTDHTKGRNCLLKHVIEGNIEGTRRQGTRHWMTLTKTEDTRI